MVAIGRGRLYGGRWHGSSEVRGVEHEGRPRVSPEMEARIRSMRAEGFGMTAISKALSVGGATVKRVLDSR